MSSTTYNQTNFLSQTGHRFCVVWHHWREQQENLVLYQSWQRVPHQHCQRSYFLRHRHIWAQRHLLALDFEICRGILKAHNCTQMSHFSHMEVSQLRDEVFLNSIPVHSHELGFLLSFSPDHSCRREQLSDQDRWRRHLHDMCILGIYFESFLQQERTRL